jgi:hypothetical protein
MNGVHGARVSGEGMNISGGQKGYQEEGLKLRSANRYSLRGK